MHRKCPQMWWNTQYITGREGELSGPLNTSIPTKKWKFSWKFFEKKRSKFFQNNCLKAPLSMQQLVHSHSQIFTNVTKFNNFNKKLTELTRHGGANMTADCIDTPLPQHYTWSDLSVNLGSDLRPEHLGHLGLPFLASQDALEVTLVTDWLTYWLTDWTLALTWPMWPWWAMIP